MTKQLPPWLSQLPSEQQAAVLFSTKRLLDEREPWLSLYEGCAAFESETESVKLLLKLYRRCLFDAESGISKSGVWDAESNFFWDLDQLTVGNLRCLLTAFEILGYKHPHPPTRQFWGAVYKRLAQTLSLETETEEQLDKRLGE